MSPGTGASPAQQASPEFSAAPRGRGLDQGVRWLKSFSSRIPFFWQVQLSAWLAFAVLTVPLKVNAYGSLFAALTVTVLREPLGLLVTSGFRILYGRLNLRLDQAGRLVLWVLPLSVLAGFADYLIEIAISRHFNLPSPPHSPEGLLYFRALLFCVWSFLYFWIKDYRAGRLNLLELARAESAAREAEILMLRAQVSPHFLFNSFNTILANLGARPAAVEAIVLGLSDYFRYSLKNRKSISVTIGEEFDAMASYLLVEKERFRDSIVIQTSIDPAVRSVQVPGVFLQPLLENALQYSLRTSPLPRRIGMDVQGSPKGGITLTVTNSGHWVEAPPPDGNHPGTGGLATLRRRLELLYPDSHELRHGSNARGDEVIVRVELPPLDARESRS